MSLVDIDAIRQRAAAATPGPWVFDAEVTDIQSVEGTLVTESASRDDGRFIAAAREDVIALCAEVEWLRRTLGVVVIEAAIAIVLLRSQQEAKR